MHYIGNINKIFFIEHLLRLYIYIVFLNNIRKLLIVLFLFVNIFICRSNAEESRSFGESGTPGSSATMETILDLVENITCETQGIGSLLRSEFTHTCTPSSFSNFFVANIISPINYAPMFLRLSIDDDELFPSTCERGNRIDPYDMKLSFAMCSNKKLVVARVNAIAAVVPAIAEAYIKNTDPWEVIQDVWNVPKNTYYETFIDKREGEEGEMQDQLRAYSWKVVRKKDTLCMTTKGFGGWVPVGCKYIKEPYPVSIYSDFMDTNPEGPVRTNRSSSAQSLNVGNAEGSDSEQFRSLTRCGNMGSCYKRSHDNSKTPVVITGPIIECVKEMIAKLMISSEVCNFEDVQRVLGSSARSSSAIFQFQVSMHKIVSALLTIYVILFGFKVVLAGDVPPKSEFINFVIKFLFVVYFSVGININVGSDNDLDRMDGMIQWAFPFLLNGMSQIAAWVINASPSELCVFSDVYYPDSLKHLQLWDALDCRISHYLGLDMMHTMIVENSTREHNWSKWDILSFPIPAYLYLLYPALKSGVFILVILVLAYPLLVISIGAFIVSSTVVCMISIVILGVLAPLFVPMYLFEYTKGYFEAWVKLLISFLLQPMVAVVFMTVMMSVYDFGFYGTCKYTSKDFSYTGQNFTIATSSASTPIATSNGRTVRYSSLNHNWSQYTKEEKRGCQDSLGYMINNPFQAVFNTGEDLAKTASMPWIEDATGNEDKKRFTFLEGIKNTSGMFFNVTELIFEKLKKLIISMLTACLILYLMYHFSSTLAEFAADMTEGVAISNVAIKPQSVFKTAASGIKTAMALTAISNTARGGDDASGDSMSIDRGDGASGDSMSTDRGDSASGDSMSTDRGDSASGDSMSTDRGDGASGR